MSTAKIGANGGRHKEDWDNLKKGFFSKIEIS